MCDAVIIGAAIADILLKPVDASVFEQGSCAVEHIRMSLGGDALNESTILARLGHAPMLVTKLGMDAVAEIILDHCAQEGISVHAVRDAAMDTGINAVLVAPDGERSFVTNRNGSLRRLSRADVMPALETETFARAKLICLASMFVSPQLSAADMEALFASVKAAGKILCADTTKRKNGETVDDVAGALKHLDYFFPNLEEARLLTGLAEPETIAQRLVEVGVGCAVIKLGGQGCLIGTQRGNIRIPAYAGANCVDTTGAGDSFAAAFIAGLLEGRTLTECGALANAVASICVEQLGATAAKLDRQKIDTRCKKILSEM